jgi:hypothetical protein
VAQCTLDPQLRQVADALSKKFDEAYDNNDAAAVAALFTEDAVLVTNARTDLRSGGHRETLRRRVPESAFQQPYRQARSVFPSQQMHVSSNSPMRLRIWFVQRSSARHMRWLNRWIRARLLPQLSLEEIRSETYLLLSDNGLDIRASKRLSSSFADAVSKFTEQCDTYSCAQGRLRRPGFGSGPLSPMPDRMTGLRSGNSATRESLPPMAST